MDSMENKLCKKKRESVQSLGWFLNFGKKVAEKLLPWKAAVLQIFLNNCYKGSFSLLVNQNMPLEFVVHWVCAVDLIKVTHQSPDILEKIHLKIGQAADNDKNWLFS